MLQKGNFSRNHSLLLPGLKKVYHTRLKRSFFHFSFGKILVFIPDIEWSVNEFNIFRNIHTFEIRPLQDQEMFLALPVPRLYIPEFFRWFSRKCITSVTSFTKIKSRICSPSLNFGLCERNSFIYRFPLFGWRNVGLPMPSCPLWYSFAHIH